MRRFAPSVRQQSECARAILPTDRLKPSAGSTARFDRLNPLVFPGSEGYADCVKTLEELTILTPNKPGRLSSVLVALAREGINLIAVDSSSGYDVNLVRLVTSDPAKAAAILDKLGYQVGRAEVAAFTVTDYPGQLARVTRALAREKVNIDYMYATAAASGSSALVIAHLSDMRAARAALQRARLA